MKRELDEVIDGYVTAMLWSSTDDDEQPLDANYDKDDLAPETMAEVRRVCEDFLRLLEGKYIYRHIVGSAEEQCLGHDLWLTSRGHGVGFWESGRWFGDMSPDELCEACYKAHGGAIERLRGCGESAYVGDDGLIYL